MSRICFLPPTSTVKVIELVPFVYVCVWVCETRYVCVCACVNPSWQKDFRAKGLYIKGRREVCEHSGIFIYPKERHMQQKDYQEAV